MQSVRRGYTKNSEEYWDNKAGAIPANESERNLFLMQNQHMRNTMNDVQYNQLTGQENYAGKEIFTGKDVYPTKNYGQNKDDYSKNGQLRLSTSMGLARPKTDHFMTQGNSQKIIPIDTVPHTDKMFSLNHI
jgi:hypothetical protein